MFRVRELIAGSKDKRDRYDRSRNSAAMIQQIIACFHIQGLTGDRLWDLVSLTWTTKNSDDISRYKLPALARLFKSAVRSPISIAALKLPESVAEAADEKTGIVNYYNARRNSSRQWCEANTVTLRDLVQNASKLNSNNEARFRLAAEIGRLPDVPLPDGTKPSSAAKLLTPLIACLDPLSRFPVVNGNKDVIKLLDNMKLASDSLESQVKGLVGLIDNCGISDAFMIDVCAKELSAVVKGLAPLKANGKQGVPLGKKDEAERQAILKGRTLKFRKRHNRMTNALRSIFVALVPKQGERSNEYDLRLENYDGNGRDLLIEVKPDPDKGSLRIAIGQLYDYRRFLNNHAATDLAILTISKPETSYMDLLLVDRNISALWFEDESCESLKGEGTAWPPLALALQKN